MSYLKSFMKVRREKKNENSVAKNLGQVILSLETQIDNQSRAIDLMQKKYNTDEVPIIVNGPLFFQISFKDIILLVKQLSKDKDANQRNLHARLLAQHLYEFLDDTKDFLGPKMKDSLKNLPDENLLVADLYKVKEIYAAFKNHCFKRLADIRHSAAAHKEQNSKILQNKIQNLDEKQIAIDTVFCCILFSLIVHFQNNIYNSIFIRLNEKRDYSEKIVVHEKYVTVKAKFNEAIFKAQGMDSKTAEFLSGLTDDERSKLKSKLDEVVNYIKDNKISQSKKKGSHQLS